MPNIHLDHEAEMQLLESCHKNRKFGPSNPNYDSTELFSYRLTVLSLMESDSDFAWKKKWLVFQIMSILRQNEKRKK